LIDGDVSQ
jgi:acyl-CoA oxidase